MLDYVLFLIVNDRFDAAIDIFDSGCIDPASFLSLILYGISPRQQRKLLDAMPEIISAYLGITQVTGGWAIER